MSFLAVTEKNSGIVQVDYHIVTSSSNYFSLFLFKQYFKITFSHHLVEFLKIFLTVWKAILT